MSTQFGAGMGYFNGIGSINIIACPQASAQVARVQIGVANDVYMHCKLKVYLLSSNDS